MIVPILATENSQQLANEEKEDFLQQEKSEEINEEENTEENTEEEDENFEKRNRRGRRRPKIIRTGQPGRPKKIKRVPHKQMILVLFRK